MEPTGELCGSCDWFLKGIGCCNAAVADREMAKLGECKQCRFWRPQKRSTLAYSDDRLIYVEAVPKTAVSAAH
jgi:hypothetical protein